MPIFEIKTFKAGLSDYDDKGVEGSFQPGSYNLDIRKDQDTLSAGQGLVDEGITAQSPSASRSPSASVSPSASASPSPSLSRSPSASVSPSAGGSSSKSPSASVSPSHSVSPSASSSPSSSTSPSPSASHAITSVFRDFIMCFIRCSDGFVYGFGNTGYVYKRVEKNAWSVVYKFRAGIKGAYEWPSKTGKSYIYVALASELHRKEIPGSSVWNDVDKDAGWPKTNLTSADFHTMRESGGDLLICNANTAALVGYDESYTNDAVDLIPGNVTRTLVERNGRAIFGTYRTGQLHKGVNAAVDAEVPLAQVGDDGALFYANMVNSSPTKRFPGGGWVWPNAAGNQIEQANFFEWEQDASSWISKKGVGNMALFGLSDADVLPGYGSAFNGLYTYGRKRLNQPLSFNLEYLPPTPVSEIGAVIQADDATLFSYKSGSNFGVYATDSTTKAAQAVYVGLILKAPTKGVEQITSWNMAEIYMQPLPAGCSVEFWYKVDRSSGFHTQAKAADGNLAYSTAGGKKAVFFIKAAGDLFEPYLVLKCSGNNSPEVNRMRIFFE